MRVGATSEDKLESIIRGGGARGELYAALRRFHDKYANLIRERFPKNVPRRVSGYNLEELLPEKGFHLARALVGSEATLVAILQATLHLVPSPKSRSLAAIGVVSTVPLILDIWGNRTSTAGHFDQPSLATLAR